MQLKICFFLFFGFMSHSGWAQSTPSVHVYFATAKWELSSSAKATLDSLTDSLDVADRIELHGHCDAVGGNSYNEELSAKRVQAVNRYLLSIGWEQQDIKVVQAHGENLPLNKNLSPEERSLNRRVEIKIIHSAINKGQSLTEKLADSTLTTGTNIVLRNINFVGGLPHFLPESMPMLNELLNAMNTFPNLVIEIQGHICCQSDDRDGLNMETAYHTLSADRAKAVKDYLIAKGIAPTRVSSRGFGHSLPLYPYPERSEAERIANRRVEIKIISK